MIIMPREIIIAALAFLVLLLGRGESVSQGVYTIPDLDHGKAEMIKKELGGNQELRGVDVDENTKKVQITYPTRNPGALEQAKNTLQSKGITLNPA